MYLALIGLMRRSPEISRIAKTTKMGRGPVPLPMARNRASVAECKMSGARRCGVLKNGFDLAQAQAMLLAFFCVAFIPIKSINHTNIWQGSNLYIQMSIGLFWGLQRAGGKRSDGRVVAIRP